MICFRGIIFRLENRTERRLAGRFYLLPGRILTVNDVGILSKCVCMCCTARTASTVLHILHHRKKKERLTFNRLCDKQKNKANRFEVSHFVCCEANFCFHFSVSVRLSSIRLTTTTRWSPKLFALYVHCRRT